MKIDLTDVQKLHKPVLTDEIEKFLKIRNIAHLRPKAKVIDATLGMGGHSERFLKHGVAVLGIDADHTSLEVAKERLKKACPSLNDDIERPDFIAVHGNFKDIDTLASENFFSGAQAILFDLGISSYQLDRGSFGLSFSGLDDELDMRIDREKQSVKGKDLLNALNRGALENLFDRVFENRKVSREISERVIAFRENRKFEKVSDFLSAISGIRTGGYRIDPSTLPFLALRIAVNSELENLEEALPKALGLLVPKGRIAVISFHSLEDKIVKEFVRKMENLGLGISVTKKPIVPKTPEVADNPRSRSAKMRIIEKV